MEKDTKMGLATMGSLCLLLLVGAAIFGCLRDMSIAMCGAVLMLAVIYAIMNFWFWVFGVEAKEE